MRKKKLTFFQLYTSTFSDKMAERHYHMTEVRYGEGVSGNVFAQN